jgi:hypothetical protein
MNKYALNIKEIQPNFPSLPLVTQNQQQSLNAGFTQARHLSTINIGSYSPNKISSLIKLKNIQSSTSNSDIPNFNKNAYIYNDGNESTSKLIQSQNNYNILLSKINKKKSIELHDSLTTFLRSNTYVGSNHRNYMNGMTKISK